MQLVRVGLCAFGMSGKVFHAPFINEHPGFFLEGIVERTKEESKKNQDPKVKTVESSTLPKVEEEKIAPAPTPVSAAKKKLSFKEQRELEQIEKEMPKKESERNKILEFLNNESDYEKISKFSADLEAISLQLEEMEFRWLELQEMQGL